MRFVFLCAPLVALAACAAPTTSEPPLTGDKPTSGPTLSTSGPVRVGGGYRAPDDPCRRAGETELTAPFASDDTDLVACPVSFDGRPAFIQATSAREATRAGDWVVYIVPLVGAAPVAQMPAPGPVTGQGAVDS